MARLPQQSSNKLPAQPADDYALMAGIRARDHAAFAAFYDHYCSLVYGLCLRALRDPSDAEDLLIDIFSEVWERGDRYDPTRGTPVGHLMGLSRSRIVDRLRSRKSGARLMIERSTDVNQAAAETRGIDGPLPSAIDSEQRARISRALKTLAPEQRQALELAYFEAMSHSEVADRLAQPLGTVKSRIRQALLQLRDILAQD